MCSKDHGGCRDIFIDLFIVRHGQTVEHDTGLCTGPDVVLSAEGKAQAGRLGVNLAKQVSKFDVVYSSPLPRALETAQIILSKFSEPMEIIQDSRIQEWDAKGYVGTRWEDVKKQQGQGIERADPFYDFNEFSFPGSETVQEMCHRINSFSQDLVKTAYPLKPVTPKNGTRKTVLVVTHGMLVRIFMKGHKPHTEEAYVESGYEESLHEESLRNTAYHHVSNRIIYTPGIQDSIGFEYKFLKTHQADHL